MTTPRLPLPVWHVGTEAWIAKASEILCFRAPGQPEGSKAGPDDLFACPYTPGHDGDCTFSNAATLEAIVADRAGIRP